VRVAVGKGVVGVGVGIFVGGGGVVGLDDVIVDGRSEVTIEVLRVVIVGVVPHVVGGHKVATGLLFSGC